MRDELNGARSLHNDRAFHAHYNLNAAVTRRGAVKLLLCLLPNQSLGIPQGSH
jgi:hypothetical protein